MRITLERGSGSIATIMALGGLVALLGGLLAGVAVIRQSTEALRTAERLAIAAATDLAAGERDPCLRLVAIALDCVATAPTVTVTVSVRGVTAAATAGPQR